MAREIIDDRADYNLIQNNPSLKKSQEKLLFQKMLKGVREPSRADTKKVKVGVEEMYFKSRI